MATPTKINKAIETASEAAKTTLDANQAAKGVGSPVAGVDREKYAKQLEQSLKQAYVARNELNVAIEKGEESLNRIKPGR